MVEVEHKAEFEDSDGIKYEATVDKYNHWRVEGDGLQGAISQAVAIQVAFSVVEGAVWEPHDSSGHKYILAAMEALPGFKVTLCPEPPGSPLYCVNKNL